MRHAQANRTGLDEILERAIALLLLCFKVVPLSEAPWAGLGKGVSGWVRICFLGGAVPSENVLLRGLRRCSLLPKKVVWVSEASLESPFEFHRTTSRVCCNICQRIGAQCPRRTLDQTRGHERSRDKTC